MLLHKSKSTNAFGIPFSVLFVFFVPGHMFDWAIEWTWLGVQLLATLIWFFVLRHRFKPTAGLDTSTWIMCFVFITVSGMLGTLYSSLVLNFQIDSKDMQDLMRFLIFIPLALFIGSAIEERDIDGLTLAVKMVVFFQLATSTILLLEIPILSNIVTYIYADAKLQYDFGHIRIGIPFANPNFAALFFLFSLSYFTAFKKSKVFAILSFFSLFLTGSRSGLISALPTLLLAYFYFLKNAISSRKSIVIFVFLHLAIFYLFATLVDAVDDFSRIVELIDAMKGGDIGGVDTASIRLDLINNAVTYIVTSPFFGVGPGRAYGLDVNDSQLISWPLMYGIPCGLFISGFFAFIFLNIARNAKVRIQAAGAVALFLSFFLMLSAGDFMRNYRFFFITILFAHSMKLIASGDISKKN